METDINKVRRDRLNQVIDELKIKPVEFTDSNKDLPGDADTFSQSYISDMRKGLKPISDKSIRRLKKLSHKLDNICEDWLLGYSDCKTETEYLLNTAGQNIYKANTKFLGLKQFLESYGYFLFHGIFGDYNPNLKISKEEAEQKLEEMEQSYMICKGEEKWFCSKEEFEQFEDDVMQIITVLINKLPKV